MPIFFSLQKSFGLMIDSKKKKLNNCWSQVPSRWNFMQNEFDLEVLFWNESNIEITPC